jgi:hypothetical protein
LYFDATVSGEEQLIFISSSGKLEIQLALVDESVTFQFGLYFRE